MKGEAKFKDNEKKIIKVLLGSQRDFIAPSVLKVWSPFFRFLKKNLRESDYIKLPSIA